MRFKGEKDQSIEFKIVGYQFPEITDGSWDSNWLLLSFTINGQSGTKTHSAASLTTWEVQDMIQWLEAIGRKEYAISPEMRFTEPDLSFSIISPPQAAYKSIRIQVDLGKDLMDSGLYVLEVSADSKEIFAMISELKQALEAFPVR